MKVYIGIDWSQNKHDLCVLNQAGACLAQIVIAHSQSGFWQIEELRNKIGAEKQDCLVGLETAHNPEVAGSRPAPATQFLETTNIQSCVVSCYFLEDIKEMLK